MEIEISKKLYEEIKQYCTVNQITSINNFIEKTLKKGFDLEKWGNIHFVSEEEAKIIEEINPEALKPVVEKINTIPTLPLSQAPRVIIEGKEPPKPKSAKHIENQTNDDIYGDE